MAIFDSYLSPYFYFPTNGYYRVIDLTLKKLIIWFSRLTSFQISCFLQHLFAFAYATFCASDGWVPLFLTDSLWLLYLSFLFRFTFFSTLSSIFDDFHLSQLQSILKLFSRVFSLLLLHFLLFEYALSTLEY